MFVAEEVKEKKRRGSPQNLVQNRPDEFDAEWIRARNSKAGKASHKKRYQRKLQNELLRDLMRLECDDEKVAQELEAFGFDPTFGAAALLAVMRKAVNGDLDSLRYIRDTSGEKPTENMQLGVFNTPVKALDMTKLSDAELEALADRTDCEELAEV
jgi:hypothetical protein